MTLTDIRRAQHRLAITGRATTRPLRISHSPVYGRKSTCSLVATLRSIQCYRHFRRGFAAGQTVYRLPALSFTAPLVIPYSICIVEWSGLHVWQDVDGHVVLWL